MKNDDEKSPGKIFISRFTGNRGAVAVIVGICLFALAVATALAVDVGSLFEDRRHLQTVADAAALAGAQELPEEPASAISKSTDYANENYFGEIDEIYVQITDTLAPNDTINVTVYNPDSPLYFASVMDKLSTPVGAKATAIVAKPVGVGNVVPWGLDKDFFDDLEPGSEYPLKYHSHQEPGNFMALDLDGHHGGGNSDYVDRIINGYDELLYVGDMIYTETGNMATTVSATEERIDGIGDGWQDFDELTDPFGDGYMLRGSDTQFVVVPVISLEGIVGQNQQVMIEGFVTMIVTAIDGPNPGKSDIIGTFVDKSLIITEGSALEPVGETGLRVIRLID
jgi:Flp pilus assembly protein TadG